MLKILEDAISSLLTRKSAKFLDIARKTAAGEEIEPDLVLDAIGEAGKSVSDFNYAVSIAARRAAAREEISRLPREIQALRQGVADRQAEFDKVSTQYHELRGSIFNMENTLQLKESRLGGMKKYLIDSCLDTALVEKCRAAKAKFHERNFRINNLIRTISANADYNLHMGRLYESELACDTPGLHTFAKPIYGRTQSVVDAGKQKRFVHDSAVAEKARLEAEIAAAGGETHHDGLLMAA